MKLNEIFAHIEVTSFAADLGLDIQTLSHNSKENTQNGLYFAVSGYSVDGIDFAKEAVENGAVAVVCERPLQENIPHIIVPNARRAMAQAASQFFGNPKDKLQLVAVVGTNGKTSTAEIIRQILQKSGRNAATIGTLGIRTEELVADVGLTTPDPIILHKYLAKLQQSGVECVIIEASAHAIFLDKLDGIVFDIGVFTNLTQDHLDFFGSMAEYKRAKLKLFNYNHVKNAVINVDDSCGMEILSRKSLPSVSYGLDNPSDIFAVNVSESGAGLSFVVNAFDELMQIDTKLSGLFNVYNVMAAIGAAKIFGISNATIIDAVCNMAPVEGRFNTVKGQGKTVVVDYAHTPDGLKNLLRSARKICTGRLIAVFGCGGNRDKSKRPIMGKIVAELSDYSVLTSDNPRFENPKDIILDIETGYLTISDQYTKMCCRRAAIMHAICMATPSDVVVIAGKGQESYMEINGIKYPHSDKIAVREIYAEKGWSL